jgi:hypothetical protein
MAEKVKYNREFLIKFCRDNNITLLKDYSKDNVNRDVRIEGKCLTHECENNFDKTFRQLYKSRGYCNICSINNTQDKIKATCLQKYGVEHNSQSELIKQKKVNTCLFNYGVDYNFKTEDYKNKCKETWLKKFGTEYPSQSDEVKNKCKLTCIEKYGYENPSQSEDIKLKKIDTYVKKYGVEHPHQIKEIRDKTKKTCLDKYGFGCALQSQTIKNKGKLTCLEKYGVEYPSQNPEIFEKRQKRSFSRKEYILPSGKVINIQGYEPYAINELIETINEDEIKTGTSNVPEIWYTDEQGKNHRYYVDIYLPSQNMCIEVKSIYTYEVDKEIVLLKQKAVKDAGYDCQIWVYDKKGVKVECIL